MKPERAIVFFAILWAISQPVWASEHSPSDDRRPRLHTLRMLEINRSFLRKAEAEYEQLKQEETSSPSEELSQRMTDLRYKIQALQEDALERQSQLPPDQSAGQFLNDLIERQSSTGNPLSPVDPDKERAIDGHVQSIVQMHEKALDEIARNHYSAAEKIYEEIVLLSPDDDEAYLLMGHTALADGNTNKASSAFANAVHIDPDNAKEITRFYENILVRNPSDVQAMVHLGFANYVVGNVEGAVQAYEDALQADPNNEDAYRALMKLAAEETERSTGIPRA